MTDLVCDAVPEGKSNHAIITSAMTTGTTNKIQRLGDPGPFFSKCWSPSDVLGELVIIAEPVHGRKARQVVPKTRLTAVESRSQFERSSASCLRPADVSL